MAKALIGHLTSDLRSSSRLVAENNRLRARVFDLEALVLRLQEQNDELVAGQAVALLEPALDEMQPV